MPYGEENLVDQHLSTIGLPLLVNSMEEFKRQHPSSKLDLAGIVFNATTDYSQEEMTAKRGSGARRKEWLARLYERGFVLALLCQRGSGRQPDFPHLAVAAEKEKAICRIG